MKKLSRLGVVVAAAVGLLAVAAPASAHVSVNPKEAVQGGYARLAFRVPNESDTAGTTKVEVFLPENAPLASVSTMPVPGWTATITKRKLTTPMEVHGKSVSEVVSAITWTASAGVAIKPGQFQEFPASMGPLPTVDMIMFKTLQTYSDGNVVRWIEAPSADGAEVEHPAPVLKLTPKAEATGSAASAQAAAVSVKAAADSAPGGGGNWTGIAGLVAGVLALIVAGFALARTRPRS